MAEPLDYEKVLDRLLELAGWPKAATVRVEMGKELPAGHQPPADSTVADWVALRTVPRTDEQLELFLAAVHHLARTRQRGPVPQVTAQQWRGMAKRARARRGRTPCGTGPTAPSASPARTPGRRANWRKDVAECAAWYLLEPGGAEAEPAGALKEQAQELAQRLAELYDEVRGTFDGDPWRDEHLARRISRRTNQLIHLLWRGKPGFLSPAEAALIALLPFLHQVHRARTAAELSHVDPVDLGQWTAPDEDRRMYEVLLGGHERLVRRAELGALAEAGVLLDRRDGRPEIGWWLFHQWAGRQPGRLPDLLSAVDTHASSLDDLTVLLEPDLLSRLLHCAYAGPSELFEHLGKDRFQLDFHGRDFQDVRERLVGPLFSLAHAMAIEVTGLSSVIVRHVGIPEALNPGTLVTTIEKASWPPRGDGDGIGLKADCRHPAVVAALTEHTQRFESLLRVVRRTGAPEFARLPLYTWADEIREVDEKGVRVPVGGVIRFRLDEERVQELLMGENLYRDRSLAIRELYQNALDACRYRRARSRAADGFDSYKGRIEFTQGFDKDERRHYLECRDNGVGMDELTLSEVFSKAGVRFTDLPRYREERQEWEDRGITLSPNSRFGIGVLSYFMLADEVRVTTCHMDPVDGRLREISVLITGPGHYFRVRPTGRAGTIGTTVRLYLRDGDKAPSCVRELRRFLGIAEFATTASHEGQPVRWDPGMMRPREPMGLEPNGFEAHGNHVSWSAGPHGEDGQVVWCEHGGGILVDGIHTEPRVLRGVLSAMSDSRRPRGVVVNLTGRSRPRRLSVDRTEILDDDLCVNVEQLVRDALPTLLSAEPALLTHEWLTDVAHRNLRLADIVTEAAGAAGYELELHGTASAVAVAGFFPSDVEIFGRDDLDAPRPWISTYGSPDDPTLLWRLLAHRPNAMLTALAETVPELNQVESVLPALPSDNFARTLGGLRLGDRSWPGQRNAARTADPGHAFSLASVCGLSYEKAVARLAELRLPTPEPPDADPVVDEIHLALVSSDLYSRAGLPWSPLRADATVPPGHLLKAHFEFGISVEEAALRLRAFGFRVPEPPPSADDMDEAAIRLFSRDLDGQYSWLDIDEPVLPQHLYRAYSELGLGIGKAIQCLTAFGFSVHGASAMTDDPDESTVRLFTDGSVQLMDLTKPVPASRLLQIAAELDRPVAEVVREFRAHDVAVEISPVHEQLPLDVLKDSSDWGLDIGDWGYLCDSGKVLPGLLVHSASLRGASLEETARHFQTLGFETPATLPPQTDDTDVVILSLNLTGGHPWWKEDDSVPALHVARASLHTGMPPVAVASRLRAYGLLPPDTSLPAQPMPEGDFRVNAYFRDLSRYGNEPLEMGKPVPLHYLVTIAPFLFTEPRKVAEWLSAYGFQVSTDRLDQLDEADRGLCLSLFRGATTLPTSFPLNLDAPLSDFLQTSEASRLPARELVKRLERLDVDLDRVREAVRAALPKVPGLVMKPEQGAGPEAGQPPDAT
ncbi:hypothetical protein ACFS5L_28295 [Streptomyces phyllanthi]|uniref:ATP-binding protein n=1 Tax=Streptomyces phyllanthi TaxID=1803180 RepID=A0A5N8W291_9ACTN|nr:hypothetical protein [Streptomyces phyllanthi]MPY41611.1 hypothetical protein [Streptomyces phyllanthi]